ncbi:glycosyltransferase family 4 protein [Chryseomicrobium palamuruense]
MIIHVISGGETGGSKNHVISLLANFPTHSAELILFQEGPFARQAREAGIIVHVIKQKNRYDLSILQQLKKLITRNEVSVVHSHGARANLFISFIRQKKFKWFTTIHSDPSLDFIGRGLKGTIFTTINKRVINQIDHFFVVSERFKHLMMKQNISEHKITVVYNGIDFEPKSFTAISRSELGLSETSFVISMVARLHPIKNYPLAFEVVRELQLEGHNVELLAIGDGPLSDELATLAKNYNGIHMLGFREDIPALLNCSDSLLLVSSSESFPLVLLEAAKAKIPVLTTDVGGVRDLVVSPKMGAVVSINDKDALVAEMKRFILAKKEGKIKEMGEILHEHAKSNFSITQLVDATLLTYSQVN